MASIWGVWVVTSLMCRKSLASKLTPEPWTGHSSSSTPQ